LNKKFWRQGLDANWHEMTSNVKAADFLHFFPGKKNRNFLFLYSGGGKGNAPPEVRESNCQCESGRQSIKFRIMFDKFSINFGWFLINFRFMFD
jgi:hypothetical protein